jgi:hypothetical protein
MPTIIGVDEHGNRVSAPYTVTQGQSNSAPPPAGGYFPLTAAGDFPVPAGTPWASLPSDAQAAAMVVRSTWEPRPENHAANNTLRSDGKPTVGQTAVPLWTYARVTGQCPLSSPTTDELIQWTAAKWGLSDELIRAQMTQESHWYQNLKWSDSMPASVLARFGLSGRPAACPVGTPVFACGYGDYAPGSGNTHGAPNAAPGKAYNKSLGGVLVDSQFSGNRVLGPESYGISQCRWWVDSPTVGKSDVGNYPWEELSTAYALDFYGMSIRSQYDGLNQWMAGNYTAYKANPGGTIGVWGSVGNWYGGDWNAGVPQSQWVGNNTPTIVYCRDVLGFLAAKPWLQSGF